MTRCAFRGPDGRLSQQALSKYGPVQPLDISASDEVQWQKWLFCFHPIHKHLRHNGYFLSVEVIREEIPYNARDAEDYPCLLLAEREDGDGSRKKIDRIVGVTAGMAEIERRVKAGEFDD